MPTSQIELLRQRIYGLALGYEDLNDHQSLRHDGAIQTAVGVLNPLVSPSTLHRLEQRHDKQSAVALLEVLLQQFIASFTKVPRELILDFDATHNIVHGEQEGRYFNGFYDEYCFLPRVLNWCDFAGIDYVIGMASNSKLTAKAGIWHLLSLTGYKASGKPQRHYGEFPYKARSWHQQRRMIVKAEHSHLGDNTRYVVTSPTDSPNASTMKSIARAATWRTASRNRNRCSLSGLPATTGGPTSSDYCCPGLPMS